jgi:hypothetical protein
VFKFKEPRQEAGRREEGGGLKKGRRKKKMRRATCDVGDVGRVGRRDVDTDRAVDVRVRGVQQLQLPL